MLVTTSLYYRYVPMASSGPFETRMGGAVEHTLAVNYFGPALLTLLLLDLVLTAAKREAEGAGAEVARVAAAGGSIVGVGHPATTTAGTAATADGGGYDVGGPRILWMASQLEGAGALDLSNLRGVHYSDSGPVPYGTSKLFCLMFAQVMSTIERLTRLIDGISASIYRVLALRV